MAQVISGLVRERQRKGLPPSTACPACNSTDHARMLWDGLPPMTPSCVSHTFNSKSTMSETLHFSWSDTSWSRALWCFSSNCIHKVLSALQYIMSTTRSVQQEAATQMQVQLHGTCINLTSSVAKCMTPNCTQMRIAVYSMCNSTSKSAGVICDDAQQHQGFSSICAKLPVVHQHQANTLFGAFYIQVPTHKLLNNMLVAACMVGCSSS